MCRKGSCRAIVSSLCWQQAFSGDGGPRTAQLGVGSWGRISLGKSPHLWLRHRASTAAQREGRFLTPYKQLPQPARLASWSAASCPGVGQLVSQFVTLIFISERAGSFATKKPALDFSRPSEFIIMCGAARA